MYRIIEHIYIIVNIIKGLILFKCHLFNKESTDYFSYKYSKVSCISSGYLVEKKEKGTQEWVRVTQFPIPTTDFIVPSLSDGQTYEFRVLAVNEGGVGKPSKPTPPVMAVRKMSKY